MPQPSVYRKLSDLYEKILTAERYLSMLVVHNPDVIDHLSAITNLKHKVEYVIDYLDTFDEQKLKEVIEVSKRILITTLQQAAKEV